MRLLLHPQFHQHLAELLATIRCRGKDLESAVYGDFGRTPLSTNGSE